MQHAPVDQIVFAQPLTVTVYPEEQKREANTVKLTPDRQSNFSFYNIS